MPAPGFQHTNSGGDASVTANPFIPTQPRISEYTALEIATLQSRLEKQLGPEFLSSRPGAGGSKIHYLAADKAIQLANEVFGFNGWSSQIMRMDMDFVDEVGSPPRINMGLSVVVRVTLKDGTFHEDVGYGHIENCKGKAAAFEKSKKEGTTDALKRALRNFGNVLGNCIYDKDFVSKVTKMKVKPTAKLDSDLLHRHSDYAPIKRNSISTTDPVGEASTRIIPELDTRESMDDEFGEFDEADFSTTDPDAHPDEIVIPPLLQDKPVRPPLPTSVHSVPGPTRQPMPQAQFVRGQPVNPPLPSNIQPKTPNAGLARANSSTRAVTPQSFQQDTGANVVRIQPPNGLPQIRKLNQPSRTNAVTISAPVSPKIGSLDDTDDLLSLPLGPPTVGFFSAKAAANLPEGVDAPPILNAPGLPAFNPNAESPSIRRTPGVDHKSSKPTSRDLKHVSGPVQASEGNPAVRNNIINPQLEATRKIGQPGSPSPMANRNSYKPPTIKRPIESTPTSERAPLGAINTNGQFGVSGDLGGDLKRKRIA